jgi:Tol biopolymer transport system component/cell wall-associated NlpC family hydrolase
MPASLGRCILLLFLALVLPLQAGSARSYDNPADIHLRDNTPDSENILADNWSGSPAVSADGRMVIFVSAASNLVSDDSNQAADIFLKEGNQNKIERLSISSAGAQGDGWSYQPALSADGRYAAFTSLATNLDPKYGTLPKQAHIFLRDLSRKQTSLITVNSEGEPANGWSEWPSISGDGRFIAFTSLADNLIPGETNHISNVFVYDRYNGQIERISGGAGDQHGTEDRREAGWSSHPAISADGRYVAYLSIQSSTQKNTTSLLVYDRLTGITADVAASAPGFKRQIAPYGPVISSDGSTLVFSAWGDDDQVALYLFNRERGQIIAIPGSQLKNASPPAFALTSNGRYVTYYSPLQNEGWEVRTYDQEDKQTLPSSISFHEALYNPDWNQLAQSADGSILVSAGTVQQAGYEFAQSISMAQGNSGVFTYEQKPYEQHSAFVSGWVSDGLGHPLVGVTISDNYGHSATTARDGSFRIDGLIPASYSLSPDKKGYAFSPTTQKVSAAATRIGASGLSFTAAPEGVLKEAQKDIGMPYALTRGCPAPNVGCGGPFHGFYSGDCTDLVIDAYREGVGFNIQQAMNFDFWAHPDHYYYWQIARSSQDMWRYFAYSGQILAHDQPYQPGDIVFFDWDGDGVSDHVSIVSEVNRRGRPAKLIDATGIINDNPSGLAAELNWQQYHEEHVQGHVRWSGTANPASQTAHKEDSFLLVALDSPQATLRLLDDQGRAIGNDVHQINNGTYTDIQTGAVIAIRSPGNDSNWYFLEISTQAPTTYQLGIQAVNSGTVTKDVSYKLSLGAGETQLIPIESKNSDEQFSFNDPQLPQSQNSASATEQLK